MSLIPPAPFIPATFLCGRMTALKPSLAASFTSFSAACTGRRSPVSPISPMHSTSAGIFTFFSSDQMASAAARSQLVPSDRSPPTTFTYTSRLSRVTPAFLSSTAIIMPRRWLSMPMAVLLAKPTLVGAVRACISRSRGLVPSYTAVATAPSALSERPSRKLWDRFSTPIRPSSLISKAPSSEVVPKRFFTARSSLRSWLRSPEN